MIDMILIWLGVGVGYITAIALIAGGGYVAFVLGANPINPLSKTLRYAGIVLMLIGLALGLVNYGKSIGGADVEAAWKARNYEAKIARLRQEASAKAVAAQTAADQAIQLARSSDAKQALIDRYEAARANAPDCRRATDDDVRRLCDIVGGGAPGCPNSK